MLDYHSRRAATSGASMMTQTTMTKGTATAAFGVFDWTAYT